MPLAEMVSLPTAVDVAQFLGETDEAAFVAQAQPHVDLTVATAKSYTRGVGFAGNACADDLAAVVITAAARLVQNPEQVKREQFGDYSVAPTTSWSLVEQAVLNRYRRRAL